MIKVGVKMRLVKFDFDFEYAYRYIRSKQKNDFKERGSLERSSYYYLNWSDFYHDVLVRTITYINDNFEGDNISFDRFLKIYYTTATFVRLEAVNKKSRKRLEFKNIDRMVTESGEEKVFNNYTTNQRPLDHVLIEREVKDQFPSISKVIEGYSFTEAGQELGITGRGFSKRYHKEVAKLIKTYHA